ncbi:MAG: SPASM domain-containing protein [Bacteroidetes bacterium]|nr:SPASM domain-containing protein [Bacteroidota bacterium]
MPLLFLQVQPNGQVGFCCANIFGSNDIGNIFENNLSELWKGNKINQIRNIFKNSVFDLLPNQCQSCSLTYNKTAQFEDCCKRKINNRV